MRNNLEGMRVANFKVDQGLFLGIANFVPADNHVLDPDTPPLLILAPAGAIDMLMPASSAATAGLTFVIVNNSANAITLKTSADAAFTTAIVVGANESTIVFCTGHVTAALGWQAIATAPST